MSASTHTPTRSGRARLSGRLAALHRLLEDLVLPALGAHPALSYREIDRA